MTASWRSDVENVPNGMSSPTPYAPTKVYCCRGYALSRAAPARSHRATSPPPACWWRPSHGTCRLRTRSVCQPPRRASPLFNRLSRPTAESNAGRECYLRNRAALTWVLVSFAGWALERLPCPAPLVDDRRKTIRRPRSGVARGYAETRSATSCSCAGTWMLRSSSSAYGST